MVDIPNKSATNNINSSISIGANTTSSKSATSQKLFDYSKIVNKKTIDLIEVNLLN